MKEIWLPVVEFPDHYEVSNLGRIRRSNDTGCCTYSGRILRSHPTNRGYLMVTFTVFGVRYSRRVARIVAEAHIGHIPNGFVVNHINGTVNDDRATNLEIVTQSENVRHALETLGVKRARGEKQHLSKLTAPLVLQIVARANSGESHQALSDDFGVTKQAVTAILTGKTWRHVTGLSKAPAKNLNKLSRQQAQAVLVYRQKGWTQQKIADHYGVSKGAINDLCAGRTWKSLSR